MLNKNTVEEIVSLCKIFAEGKENGTITKETYTSKFKDVYLKPFEDKHKKTPNLILQDELRSFFDSQLKGIHDKILYRSFGFWGNNIYSYVWTCVYFDFGKESLPASYSPQLYILVNKMGIKFGFCYGHQVSENDIIVEKGKNESARINELIQDDNEISFFNSSQEDITARPEVLFGKEERIIIKNVDDIRNNWTDKSLLIKEFPINEIPDDISENILKTLISLKQFYLTLLPIESRKSNLSVNSKDFNYDSFHQMTIAANLKFSKKLVARFVASLCTKPFVILTGLSGSGKTKMAQSFVHWICESNNQYKIVPVGADWTNREPLLGYPNALNNKEYVNPDNGVLDLLLSAVKNDNLPHFLILDEMNLSHVERYFADFLSAMESKEPIPLHNIEEEEGIKTEGKVIPGEIYLPNNLFIIGTVNIDETTYMFSPKVLDRANTIEFRIADDEIKDFLATAGVLDMCKFIDPITNKGLGADMAANFLALARNDATSHIDIKEVLFNFFKELKKPGAEFGYRSASEINRLIAILDSLVINNGPWNDFDKKEDEFMDIAIMQKLLPKLHGSRSKLVSVLTTLAKLCIENGVEKYKENDEKFSKEYFPRNKEIDMDLAKEIIYPVSFEKIARMYKNAVENGFTSYAEA